MNAAGLLTMCRIQLRTGWKATLTWILALAATMVATSASISNLYNTPAKIHEYAAAVSSGSALVMINGHVYGLDSLGGVIANEFGFVASFALPLMGISLVARSTRRDEEAGRLEVLLAGRIGRTAPLVAAVIIAACALTLTSVALGAGLVAVGVETTGSVVYAASLGALGMVFAAIAALAAQLVQHVRDVYTISVAALVLAYLLRGIGDVADNVLVWLSPLGWAEEARAFGADPRWWPMLLSLTFAAALVVAAVWLSARRDLDDALLRRGPARAEASQFLRSRTGFAIALQRGTVLRWSTLTVLIAAALGSVAQQAIDLMAGNEAMSEVFGGDGSAPGDTYLSMGVLLVAIVCGAYVVQAVGVLRGEETAGRLEAALSAPVGRVRWLGTYLWVILAGLAVVALCGGLALGLSAAWSTGEADQIGDLLLAVLAYQPAVAVLGGTAALLFGCLPRGHALAWVVFALTAGVMLLGDLLQLPDWARSLTPMYHVGYPPQDPANTASLVALAVVAAALCVAAFVGMRRRGVPQG